MAYFDSPKNRAKWEKRMVGLREERKRRMETGYVPEKTEKTAGAEENPYRKKIGLARLEEIEREISGVRRVKRPTRERAHQKTQELAAAKEQRTPSREGRSL